MLYVFFANLFYHLDFKNPIVWTLGATIVLIATTGWIARRMKKGPTKRILLILFGLCSLDLAISLGFAFIIFGSLFG